MWNYTSFILFLLLSGYSESRHYSRRSVRSTLTLEEIIPLRGEFYPDKISVRWLSDNEYLVKEGGQGSGVYLKKYDAKTDQYTVLMNASETSQLSNYTFSDFSHDGQYLLLASKVAKVYRHSKLAEYYVYDLKNKTIKKVADGPLQVIVWGEGPALAYVKNNNVFYVSDVGDPSTVRQLTTEGVPGLVYAGIADWIYEEEILNAAEALWFSPAGSYLAVATFNDTDVESAVYPYYGDPDDNYNQYPEIVEFKYPKVGRTNPTVSLKVFKLDGASPVRNIPAPVDIVGLDHILGRVSWANDDFLTVFWLNRRQSSSILVNCNLKDYKCSIVQERNEYNGWIDIHNAFFDKAGNKIMELQPASSSDERYMHVTSLDFSTMEMVDYTPGNWTVTEIAGWNRDRDSVFFVVAPEDLPWQRQLWKKEGNETICVSCKEPSCHSVSVNFAPQADYGVVTCSAKLQPPKTFFYRAQADSFTLVSDNKRLTDKLQQYRMPVPLFGKIDLSYGGKAHISLLLPPDVTSVTKELSKKFPLIVKVYAGPGTTRVKDNFDTEYYNTYLATNRSYVVASIDVRGTGAMTVDEMHAVNNVLGTVEITDTLEAIKHIVKKYSNLIDGSRVGVWGWSYGGFASTMMLVRDQERLLACGAAVAPVSSWRYYDSIYTERYMDTPANNPTGYDQSDLTALAEHLRGRKYLLIHGTGDDNVHFQHSLQLAKKLQHADIDFEQISYTDENHSLFGVSRHLYHALDRYWTECFT